MGGVCGNVEGRRQRWAPGRTSWWLNAEAEGGQGDLRSMTPEFWVGGCLANNKE